MADITYIPIRQLHPHPDNPRKELGDLSELAASIKENGVYQNLTVIPGHYLSSREYISKCVDEGGDAAAAAAAWAPKVMWVGDDYTIIIGHRRAAAAQQAGLYELPCAIVEMDEREQMQTMMVENGLSPIPRRTLSRLTKPAAEISAVFLWTTQRLTTPATARTSMRWGRVRLRTSARARTSSSETPIFPPQGLIRSSKRCANSWVVP